MLGRTPQFWLGVGFLLVGTAVLFGVILTSGTPPVLLALGVLILAAGTLLVARERGQRPV